MISGIRGMEYAAENKVKYCKEMIKLGKLWGFNEFQMASLYVDLSKTKSVYNSLKTR